jgi:hypothetical protein
MSDPRLQAEIERHPLLWRLSGYAGGHPWFRPVMAVVFVARMSWAGVRSGVDPVSAVSSSVRAMRWINRNATRTDWSDPDDLG